MPLHIKPCFTLVEHENQIGGIHFYKPRKASNLSKIIKCPYTTNRPLSLLCSISVDLSTTAGKPNADDKQGDFNSVNRDLSS